MCGIAGVMLADGRAPDPSLLEALLEGLLDGLAGALAHRGPDGQGRHVSGTTGLVHTRLAIIDLDGGAQPLHGPDGIALVANGEIYNYLKLRDEVPGVKFATQSDCEPPLHFYRKYGPNFVTRLRGMYALALHDPAQDRLILARDPFGIKPLYYAETPQGLAFASEAQALIAAGWVNAARADQPTAELLQLQFTTGRETIFRGINRVLPGEVLVVENGRVVERHRHSPLPVARHHDWNQAEALYRLDEALAESVLLHQQSDVPYGMFLSGGVDSSALLAMMERLNSTPVLAFTAGFPGTQAHDERAHAGALARSVGARHVETEVTEADFWSLLPEIAAAMDDPAADYAILPTYILAREAAKEVKVVLSGEGGDEILGGYGRYRSVMRPWPFGKSRMRRRGTFDRLPGLLRLDTTGWRDGVARSERATRSEGRTALQRAQAVDMEDWLPNDLLAKLDRCLMHHGIEGRVPFLDPGMALAGFPLNDSLKVHKGLGKWVLRRWLETALPQSHPYATKRGFTVPVAEWLSRRPELGKMLAAQDSIREIADPHRVERLFHHIDKKTGFAAWTLLFYALWHRRHIQGRPPEGDVFACLAG